MNINRINNTCQSKKKEGPDRQVSAGGFLLCWFVLAGGLLAVLSLWTLRVDPYMHFHAPLTNRYYYSLNNPRSQNDGITRHFAYDAIITGTSMSENIRATEVDALFDCKSIKIPFSGASYREINEALSRAFSYNNEVKYVFRGLDYARIIEDKDSMRFDLGVYPNYLYDANPLNDVKYLWNRGVFWNNTFPMSVFGGMEGFTPGITSFDDYGNWQNAAKFGLEEVAPEGVDAVTPGEAVHLTDDEKRMVEDNITQNVTALARANPDVTFYLFFTPYSALWWRELVENGRIYAQIEAEQIAAELMLDCDNIRLYGYNNRSDITTDLSIYKDQLHYNEDVSNRMLQWMKDDIGRITADNVADYLQDELQLYEGYEYTLLNKKSSGN